MRALAVGCRCRLSKAEFGFKSGGRIRLAEDLGGRCDRRLSVLTRVRGGSCFEAERVREVLVLAVQAPGKVRRVRLRGPEGIAPAN